MTDASRTTGWVAFWNRGGWWRVVLLSVTYLAIYLGAGLLVGTLFADRIDTSDLLSSAPSVFFALTLPLLIGSIVLAAFASSVGWLRLMFARQTVRGRRWMWFVPVIILVPSIMRLLGVDYGSYPQSAVVVMLLTGVLIGFAEEILCRGFAVKMLRDSGKSERTVMVLSSLIFALLHSTNILSGQALVTVALTIVFAFAFGVCMYLTLRVTGNLIWPMLLHGLYDPALFLSTGGIDQAATGEQSALIVLAAPANFIYIIVAIVALFVVRDRTKTPDAVLS